jgi:iron complex outermembrane receptor protein
MRTNLHTAAKTNLKFTKRLLLGSTSGAAAMVVSALMASAYAQAENQSAQSTPVEEIVVTGSRVVRDGYSAPTPVSVVSTQDINRDAPVNIADFVNKMPAFANSTSPHNSQTNVGAGGAGVNNLNLRSLGSNRTLVLLDGNRIAPAALNGAVDTNSFPTGLVSRVDVVTGGASAVYGSDALTGVVNFILDKNYEGVKGTVTVGESGYGDDQKYLFGLTGGFGFADNRGHVLLSAEYTRTNGILNNGTTKPSNRQWVNDSYYYLTNPAYTATNGLPFYLAGKGYGSTVYTLGSIITAGPLKGTAFGAGGVPYQFNYGSVNNGTAMFGGDFAQTNLLGGASTYGPAQSLDALVKRSNLFARVSYDVTDNVQFFAQFMYSQNNSGSYGGPGQVSNVVISSGNPFIPASVQAQMNALKLTSFTIGSILGDLGMAGPLNSRKMNEYIAGLTGNFDVFGTTWKWDATAERSLSRSSVDAFNDLIKPNLILAQDPVRDSTGKIVCRSTLTNPTNGCVPFNIMGTGVNSAAALAYVEGVAQLDQKIQQDDVSASMSGQPFSTWAGPVAVAFGAEHRKNGVTAVSDPLSNVNAFFVGNFHPTFGKYYVTEGFVEVDVPLATNESWAKALNLNAAVRETGYSTSGEVTTWKIGATYQPIDDLRFRATRSRDIRAPNLGEYYQAGQTNAGLVIDRFKPGNPSVQFNSTTVGNPNLTPEVADTTAGGFVYQPEFLPGFSTSVDYFNINIKDVIASAGAQQIMDSCYAGVQAFCSLITRNAATNLSYIYLSPVNTQKARENGLDIEASYTKKMDEIVAGWDGAVRLRALVTHVFNLYTLQPSGLYLQTAGANESGVPSWVYNLSVGYDNETYSASLSAHGFGRGVHNTTWVQCTTGCPAQTTFSASINDNVTPAAMYLDLNLTYHLKTDGSFKSDIFFTVDNLNNLEPNWAIIGSAGNYNLLGRSFRAGVRFSL